MGLPTLPVLVLPKYTETASKAKPINARNHFEKTYNSEAPPFFTHGSGNPRINEFTCLLIHLDSLMESFSFHFLAQNFPHFNITKLFPRLARKLNKK
jgi:hypothetical protein